jgi:hypothetical protein
VSGIRVDDRNYKLLLVGIKLAVSQKSSAKIIRSAANPLRDQSTESPPLLVDAWPSFRQGWDCHEVLIKWQRRGCPFGRAFCPAVLPRGFAS